MEEANDFFDVAAAFPGRARGHNINQATPQNLDIVESGDGEAVDDARAAVVADKDYWTKSVCLIPYALVTVRAEK